MADSCIECGKQLLITEISDGFCGYCQVKINNDFRIIDEFFYENEILESLTENIFKR
jgi:hypothetical protein